jgi:ribosome-binding factor A
VPKEFSRSRRVEENLKRLLSDLVRREVKDPRVGLVTITAVEVSRDLTHAKVYFTPFAGQGNATAALEALRHAAGFLRHELRHALTLRVIPELDFRLDEAIEEGAKVSALISEAVASDARRHVPDSGDVPESGDE